MLASKMTIGMLVTVGPAYRMSEHPPYVGNGTYEADAWTGSTMRVVAIHGNDAGLAPNHPNVTAWDEEVSIHSRRLTPA